jgi:Zn-dependent M28 family amino/carboxypeptidase
MKEIDHYYTIVYVFFGAHEAGGFLGAGYFVQGLTSEQSENLVLMINADLLFDGPHMVYGAAYDDNLQPGANDITRQIDAIAEELDLGLISHPDVVYLEVDQLPFLMRGHTVVFMAAYYRVDLPGYVGFFNIDGGEFTRGGSHTENDDFNIIEERRPGVIQTNMRAFSMFLEEMLMIQ